MNINACVVSGNLTREPVMRPNETGDGGVLSFSIASNERHRDPQTGEFVEYPNYFDCAVFGRRAVALQNILHKGTKVCVKGHLHYSTYQSKTDGSTRRSIQIYVDDLDFLSNHAGQGNGTPQQGQYGGNSGGYGNGSNAQPRQRTTQAQAPASNQPAVDNGYDEDLPF